MSPSPAPRRATVERTTAETTVKVVLDLDDPSVSDIGTGIPFFDHMLSQLAKHGNMGLVVQVKGDLEVDAHHSVEDTGIALGQCLSAALGDRRGIRRFSSLALPLDETLVEVALDISGRPFLCWEVPLVGAQALGTPGFEPQLSEEFWRAVVTNASLTLHVDLRRGRNTHHIVEAVFKAIARVLGSASEVVGEGVPSTKGVL